MKWCAFYSHSYSLEGFWDVVELRVRGGKDALCVEYKAQPALSAIIRDYIKPT